MYSRLEKYKDAIDCYRRCLEDDAAPSARRARAGFDLGNALLQARGEPSRTARLRGSCAAAYRAGLLQPDLTTDLRTFDAGTIWSWPNSSG